MPAARQHFFLFSPIFYFLPVVSSPATLPDKAGEGASFSRTPERVSILFSKKFLTANERCSAKPVPDAAIGAWGFLLLLAVVCTRLRRANFNHPCGIEPYTTRTIARRLAGRANDR